MNQTTGSRTGRSKKKYEKDVIKLKIKLWLLGFNSIADRKSIRKISGRVESIWKLLQSVLAKSSGSFVMHNKKAIIDAYKYNELHDTTSSTLPQGSEVAVQEKRGLEDSYLELMVEENALCDSLESLVAIACEAITRYLIKCNADAFEHQIFKYKYKISDYYVELFAHK